jgi:Replicase family
MFSGLLPLPSRLPRLLSAGCAHRHSLETFYRQAPLAGASFVCEVAMRDALPIWAVWTQHLPQNLRAADICADGPRLLSRDDALKCAHLEFNTRGCLGWLVFDVDQPDSFECWDRAGLPSPNFYAQNRSSGRGHLGYCLNRPVGLLGNSRRRPIELAADVQRGMTRRLGADPTYNNRLAKNPAHARWASSWHAPW